VAHKADVNARNEDAQTPLALAASRGHAAVIQRLIEAQAAPQAFDALQQTSLHAAAIAGRAEAIGALIRYHARVDQKDAAGRTPVLLALAGRHEDAVRLLLKKGAQLPEELAGSDEMRLLLRDVEEEALHEQIEEAKDGKTKEQLLAAEREFEDARLKVLNLSSLTAAALVGPAVQHAERLYHDTQQQFILQKEVEDNMRREFKGVKKTLDDTERQNDNTNAALRGSKKAVIDMRTAKNDRVDQIRTLQRDTADAQAAIKSNETRVAKLDTKIEDARGKAEALRAKLQALQEDSRQVSSELAPAQEQLAKWHASKKEAAELHAQAHALLNRREA